MGAACARPEAVPEAAVTAAPTATATVSPAPTAVPTPSPTPDPLTAENGVYTFAWLSDTQFYSNKFPDVFHAMTEFLSKERARLNLAYVIHTGDLVSWADRENDWIVARHAMDALDGVPYGVLAGNHDVTPYADRKNLSNANYIAYFGGASLTENACCADIYEDGRGHVDLISAGETDYAFCYMGYPVDEKGAEWLNGRFAAYKDRVGVLCVHDYLNTDLTRTEQGQFLFDTVVAKNDNLYMVLCGHRYNSHTVPIEVQNADGSARTVLQCISNYQAAGLEGGSGYLRFIQVNEANGTLHMLNYSPLLNDYVYYDDLENIYDPYFFDPAGEDETTPIPWRQHFAAAAPQP